MERKLYRNTQEGTLSGVCAGLADYLQFDKIWIRLFFVFSVILAPAFGLGLLGPVLYVVLWIVVPPRSSTPQGYDVDYRVRPDDDDTTVDPPPPARTKASDRTIVGLILLLAGVVLLLYQLDILEWHRISRFWPVILIITGLVIVIGGLKKTPSKSEKT